MKPSGLRRQSGATIVEMAIVAPVFLLILLALVEFSMMFFATLTMQYAVREGARYAITGQSNLDPNTGSQQRYNAVIQSIRDSSLGMYDKLAPTISVNGKSYASNAYTSGMFGTAGSIIVLQLDCDWIVTTPLLSSFFKDGKYHFAVAATMRNEYFP
ncbi:TadE/TadG family type IV pilus assembly protein [Massilia sp. YIM B02769]|jgi:Flp pilus assembly protein TadG|uniref:TadE/TadG family type IV pilus assembly protein n=1 Tax=unclassified Massilia TaxID=2609279 RepID=UPI0025B6F2B9|nr:MULTISPECIES: TadE/TadG family type IV pilus assembly protein [unclassified Massilia]MDN4057568.1 TadE/TadG family type IV pilus assembly protein [Massilia sp. YIM B02769]